jgi:hypothetical protein
MRFRSAVSVRNTRWVKRGSMVATALSIRAALDLISATGETGGGFVSVSGFLSSFVFASSGFISTSGMVKARLGFRVVTRPGPGVPGPRVDHTSNTIPEYTANIPQLILHNIIFCEHDTFLFPSFFIHVPRSTWIPQLSRVRDKTDATHIHGEYSALLLTVFDAIKEPAGTNRTATDVVRTAIEGQDCLWLRRDWAHPWRPDPKSTGSIRTPDCSEMEAYIGRSTRPLVWMRTR